MTTITLRGIEFIFSSHVRLGKAELDALRQEFNKADMREQVVIEHVKGNNNLIKVMVPTSHDLLMVVMEKTIHRINAIIKVR